jgi:arabinofuranosyltransferase
VRRILVIVGLAAAVIGLLWHVSRYAFICDDAYISFRYAENLARHGELTWNLGEPRVEGYTNFLWTVLLAAGIRSGISPERLAPFLGALFGVITLLGLFWMGRVLLGAGGPDPHRLHRRIAAHREWLGGLAPLTGWEVLPAGLAAAWGAFACWSSGGLETPLFTALVVLAITQYLREEVSGQLLRPSGVVFALAALTRPEGVLVFAVAVAHRVTWSLGGVLLAAAQRRGDLRQRLDGLLQRELLWLLGFGLIYGAYFAWRYEYYGDLYPNTYHIKKATTSAALTREIGMAYLQSFVRDYRLLWLVPALPLAFLAARPEGRAGLRRGAFLLTLVLPLGVVWAWHVVRFGGDFMAMHRFWVPLVPLLALVLGLGIRAATELTLGLRLGPTGRLLLCLVVSAAAISALAARSTALGRRTLTTLTLTPTGYEGSYDGMETVAFMRKFARDRVLIGRWLRARVPRDALMAVGGAGALVYHSGLRAIDSFGLSDRWVARNVKPVSHRPGHQVRAPLSYVLGRKPDLICYPGIVKVLNWEYRPSPGEARQWERQGYGYFCATPGRLYPSHYCCLMRLDQDLGLAPVR